MIVAARQLGYSVGARAVFAGVHLDAQPGRVTALTGPSGSGKSALLHILGLLTNPTTGTVTIDGDDASAWSVARRRKFWATSAAFVLQDGDLVEEESVAYNITMSKTLFRGRLNGNHARITEALAAVGLSGREDDRAVGLSGGEKQRLSFARALYKDAQVVYVDEPTAALDVANRNNLASMMCRLANQDRTVIIATHDDTLISCADEVFDVAEASMTHHR